MRHLKATERKLSMKSIKKVSIQSMKNLLIKQSLFIHSMKLLLIRQNLSIHTTRNLLIRKNQFMKNQYTKRYPSTTEPRVSMTNHMKMSLLPLRLRKQVMRFIMRIAKALTSKSHTTIKSKSTIMKKLVISHLLRMPQFMGQLMDQSMDQFMGQPKRKAIEACTANLLNLMKRK